MAMRKLTSSLDDTSVLESLKLALEQKPPLSDEVSEQSVLFVFFLLSHLKSTGRREDLGESFGKSWLRWPSFWCLISPFQCIHLIYQTVRSLPSDDANSNIRLRLHVALRSSLPFLLDDVINFVDSAQEVLQHFSKCRIMKSEKNEKKDVKNIWIRPIHTSSQ